MSFSASCMAIDPNDDEGTRLHALQIQHPETKQNARDYGPFTVKLHDQVFEDVQFCPQYLTADEMLVMESLEQWGHIEMITAEDGNGVSFSPFTPPHLPESAILCALIPRFIPWKVYIPSINDLLADRVEQCQQEGIPAHEASVSEMEKMQIIVTALGHKIFPLLGGLLRQALTRLWQL